MNFTKEQIDAVATKVAAGLKERKAIHGVPTDETQESQIASLRTRIMMANLSKQTRELAKLTNNFELTTEWLKALRARAAGDDAPYNRVQEKLAKRAMAEGTAGAGGSLVPEEFSQLIMTKMSPIAKMRKYATVIPMVTDTLHVPYDNANVTVYWKGENVALVESNATFGEAELTPYKLTVLSIASNELLDDANVRIIDYLAAQFARKFAAEEDKKFFIGDGSGVPTGVRTVSGATSVAQAGASLAYSDILNVFMSLPEQYRAKAQWFCAPATIQKIMGLTDDYGRPIFMPSYQEGKPATLFGLPLLEVYDFPTNLGAHSDTSELWIGDLSTYVIGDRQDIQVAVTKDRYFEYDQTGVKATLRVDGEPTIGEAFAVCTGIK